MAAASLTAAFTDVARGIRDAHPHLRIVYNFAGSQALRTQLEQGAVADVFASANDAQMQRALDSGLIDGPPQIFVRNTLLIIVPRANPSQVTSFEHLAKPGLKLTLAGPQVPVGHYSREILQAAQADHGTDFALRVLRNLVSEETSVKQVLGQSSAWRGGCRHRVRFGRVRKSPAGRRHRSHSGGIQSPRRLSHRGNAGGAQSLRSGGLHPLRALAGRAGHSESSRLHSSHRISFSHAKTSAPTSRSWLLAGRSFLWRIPALVAVTFLVLPLLAIFLKVVPQSHLWHTLQEPFVTHALRTSLITSLSSLVLTIAFGTPLAYALARRRVPGTTLFDTLLDLPMVLPPTVAGVALLMTFGRRGLLGPWLDALGIQVVFTAAAVVLAQSFVSMPLYVRSAQAGFRGVDPELERVAYTLGYSTTRTFLRVTVPLAFPALLSGAVMAWARALGEFGATIMFAGNLTGRTQTMPLAIYIAMESDLTTALVLATLLIIVPFGCLFATRFIARRRSYGTYA